MAGQAMTKIYTIGYEGTDIGRFIETLLHVGIDRVVDVRAVPISRKKGFSKNKLAEQLQAAGLGYSHIGELGDPKPGREAAKAKRFDEFRRIYGSHLSKAPSQAAIRVLSEQAKSESVCLLCFERDPATCHRRLIAEAMERYGLSYFDLYGDLPRRYVGFKGSRPHSRQSTAAA
jgi:uncharacterized protein (DUF488 family)